MIRTPNRERTLRHFTLDKNAPTAWKTLALLGLALGAVFTLSYPKEAQSTTPSLIVYQEPKSSPTVKANETVEDMIIRIAKEEGYKAPLFAVSVARCESNLNPNAVGDSGKSRGLWQIHKPSHPTVTSEQAFDPEWSTRWSMKKFVAGQANLWTCARLLS